MIIIKKVTEITLPIQSMQLSSLHIVPLAVRSHSQCIQTRTFRSTL